MTALYMATAANKLDVVRELLARGAAVDARCATGESPLIIAAYHGHTSVLRELLAHGADVNARTNAGLTALICAAMRDFAEVVRELLMRLDVDVGLLTNAGQSALQHATTDHIRGMLRARGAR